jgi:AcrR family transcriptional regulator
MGIKERQERDRESVRRSILDAARELFVSEGYQNVSIRKIAERIEYSPASIYSYFPSKDDIFYALAEEGFRLLGDPARADAAAALLLLPSLERLRALFRRFYEFSRQHPQYFALMFIDRSVPRISREYERFAFARTLKGHLVGHIQECINDGTFPQTVDPHVALRLITAGLLGVVVMRLSDRLPANENADLLADDILNVTLTGLQSGAVLASKGTVDCVGSETAGGGEDEAGVQAS